MVHDVHFIAFLLYHFTSYVVSYLTYEVMFSCQVIVCVTPGDSGKNGRDKPVRDVLRTPFAAVPLRNFSGSRLACKILQRSSFVR